MDHSIRHRMLSGWVFYIGPKLNLDMGPGLVEVGGDSQHLSLTGCDSLVNREQGCTETSNSVGEDVFGCVHTCGCGWDLDHVSITTRQLDLRDWDMTYSEIPSALNAFL